jgi:hypothetical protein
MSWFSDFVDSIRDAFSGNNRSDTSSSNGGDRAPTSSRRPGEKPSILSRSTDNGREYVATRDMPRFGLEAGQRESEPDYGAASLRGLTSTDPGNVMRNIQGAERNARAEAARTDADREDRPAPAAAPVAESVSEPAAETPETPVTPAAPATESGMTPEQEERIEQAGETAAEKQRKLGLAQTIATSPRGLLASGEGTTRRRRSLIGGGLIV